MSFSGPQAPDYTGAAETQANASKENTNAQLLANRPDMYTPWGSIDWTHNSDGSWRMNMALSPEQQSALEAQQRIGAGLSQTAEGMLGKVNDSIGTGVDWDALGMLGTGDDARKSATDAIWNQGTSRLDPMWDRREDAQRTALINQGFAPDSEAFDKQMGQFGRDRNDAYNSLFNTATITGIQAGDVALKDNILARQQKIGEGTQRQYGDLNALTALLRGQQVQMPQFPGFTPAGKADEPNYLGAAGMQYQAGLDAYNAEQMYKQGLSSGIGQFSPAGAFIPFMF